MILFKGRTHYGDVFLAKAYGIREREQETLVVVKSLVSSADHHRNEFQHEVEMFRRLNHQHIIPLLGLCKETEPVFTIYEYCERVRTRYSKITITKITVIISVMVLPLP